MVEHNEAYRAIWHAEEAQVPRGTEDFGALSVFDPETGRRLEVSEYPGARVMATHEPVLDQHLEVEHFDGSRGTNLVSAVPLHDEHGEFSGFVVVTQDVTGRRDEERRYAALVEFTTAITSTFDREEILDAVVTQGSAALGADGGLVLMADRDGWVLSAASDGHAHRVGRRFAYEDLVGARMAVEQGMPVFVGDVYEDKRIRAEIIDQMGGRAFVVVPLVLVGRPIGAISYIYDEPQTFDDAQQRYAARIQLGATLALENARRYAAEHDIADRLQAALLALPDSLPGVEFATAYHSATELTRVGGDFYDVFQIDERRVGVIMGDVAGKGLEAAALTSLVKNTIRAYALEPDRPPAGVARLANDAIWRATVPEAFATVLFGIVDCAKRTFTYANAGHPTGAMIRADGSVEPLPPTGPLLGAATGIDFTQAETAMSDEDLLFLYTDGLTEARLDQIATSEERLFDLLGELGARPATYVVDKVVEYVMSLAEFHLRDDLALLAIRVRPATD
jgi:serine phosphatase RsbU (regulator of sigma subunit)